MSALTLWNPVLHFASDAFPLLGSGWRNYGDAFIAVLTVFCSDFETSSLQVRRPRG
jgi:hypothetical protein